MDGVIENLISSAIWAILGALGLLVARWVTSVLPLRRLWRFNNPRNIIICVATSTKTDTGTYVRPATGIGQLRALALLLPSLHRAYRNVQFENIYLSEDQLQGRIEGDLILLGGPENNQITRRFLDKIRHLNCIYQDDHSIYWFDKESRTSFQALVKDGVVIRDYGLIVRMHNPFSTSHNTACLFCGTHTYGTIAAAKFFADIWHKQQQFRLVRAADVAMVVSCDVVDGYPVSLTLEKIRYL